ncbi:TniQ family protein [Streptomyces sp. NPDC001781]
MPLAGGVWRVAPLQGEMTQSFLSRVAARYGVGLRDLLAAIPEVGGLSNITGQTRLDSEVYLNRQARDRLSQLCRVPEHHLRRALPAWAQEEPRKRFAAGPAAQFHHTAEKVVPWGPACPECAARSAERAEGVRLYLEPQQRVCAVHRRWLMQEPGTAGRVVRLPVGGEPWWNPPWHFPWQRHYQQARTLWQEGRLLLPGQHTPPGDRDEDEDPLTMWLRRQCARHDVLHPEQQNLLADIGITATTARTAPRPSPLPPRERAGWPRPAATRPSTGTWP